MPPSAPPLAGLKVLDFSTLLPGPLAGLLLAEAGAEVIKVERPGTGDEMRGYAPPFDDAGGNFALLNRGKTSLTADLKDAGDREHVRALALSADILIEQFRPGVMERLGLGYEVLAADNPRLIYCSITGYGQTGARAQQAGHDLNYMAETGLLGLSRGVDGAPVLPPVLAADIAGGAYPAVLNILMALVGRSATGRGCPLDVAMADNLFTFAYWGLAAGHAGTWPRPGAELVTGGSPRYQIYRTADGRHLAAAPLEERFWQVFCDRIGLAQDERDDAADPEGVRRRVADLIQQRSAAEWRDIFGNADVCVSVVASLEEAAGDPAFIARGLFARTVAGRQATMPALPVPLDAGLRDAAAERPFPARDDAVRRIGWAAR
ncbi:MAG: CaiB/BaiF CoA-transferase family protein [Phreatobacter sp.]|nr:CaiB/BaiF CoA-transferase family protein [Phreatobacter sp.]